MDQELKQYLEEIKHGLEGRIDAVETRIMNRVESHLDSFETRLMNRVDGRMDALEERMKTHVTRECDNLETKLLTQFWKWGRTTDQRMNRLNASDASTVNRIGNLEDRVFALEQDKAKPS